MVTSSQFWFSMRRLVGPVGSGRVVSVCFPAQLVLRSRSSAGRDNHFRACVTVFPALMS
jgi:hypothetical protein